MARKSQKAIQSEQTPESPVDSARGEITRSELSKDLDVDGPVKKKKREPKKSVEIELLAEAVPEAEPFLVTPEPSLDQPLPLDHWPACQKFLNRELSWLQFNHRVLQEAQRPNVPLLERTKFLAISDTNLDEFTTVRVSSLKHRLEAGVDDTTPDGLTLSQQLVVIEEEIDKLLLEQQSVWLSLRDELADSGIRLVAPDELNSAELEWLSNHFETQILPVLTPLACDPAHPFPFIPSAGLCLALKLKDGKALWAVLPIPASLPRFIKLGTVLRRDIPRNSIETLTEDRFIATERALPLFFDKLFPNFKVKRSGVFHVLRDSEIEWDTEGKGDLDLTEIYLSAIKGRKWGHVVRLTFEPNVPTDLREFITEQLEADPEDIYELDGLLNLSDLAQLTSVDRPELKFHPQEVRFPERIKDWGGDYFAAISKKDLLVHHPYESFDVVVEFLRQAARDPEVVAIKQTLYRTSRISSIVRALIEAAEAGKSVTVVVELKARFDEEANIRLATDLERAGAHVVYGFVDVKTHAKMTLILRREPKGLKGYMHFGTGNYHPITARVYTDLSYFTCDESLLRDTVRVFNYLTGYAVPRDLQKLVVAPLTLKATLLSLIEAEIAHVAEGRPGQIWAKMNSLVDPDVCSALYRASQRGVQIDLVVRGICCLRPQIKGLSDNIRVKSIVGRFLEHSRVVCFGNGQGLPSKKAKVFLTSADWMPRNLYSRVELMIPIEADSAHAQILEQVMIANLKDTHNSWDLGADGSYRRTPETVEKFSAHEHFLSNPSLSGRGRTRRKEKVAQTISLP
jgi:polyphosphate kinase